MSERSHRSCFQGSIFASEKKTSRYFTGECDQSILVMKQERHCRRGSITGRGHYPGGNITREETLLKRDITRWGTLPEGKHYPRGNIDRGGNLLNGGHYPKGGITQGETLAEKEHYSRHYHFIRGRTLPEGDIIRWRTLPEGEHYPGAYITRGGTLPVKFRALLPGKISLRM